ncbi:MAG: DUF6320 domain-containing protein [Saccharofermentanales bacterium]
MKYCEHCRVSIPGKEQNCPLCHQILPMMDEQDHRGVYPEFEPRRRRDKKMVKAYSKTALLLIFSSIIINMMISSETWWSAIFSAFVLYIWLLGLLTFKRAAHPGLKLMAHAIAIPLLLVVINTFASNTKTFTRLSWAVSYAMPIIIICFILVINIIMYRHRQNLRNYLLYQLSLCVIGFVPLILVLSGVAKPIQPSIVAASCSFLSILALLIFSRKIVIGELGRKFHV